VIRNSIKSLRFLSILIASVFLLLEGGCGGTSGSSSSGAGKGDGGGSSGSGVSLSGSVEAPRTTTTSISVGSSASKSVGKGVGSEDSGETIIVSKATTELPVSGGECICKKLDGTKLDEFEINSAGQFSGANINPALLDSSKQVLIDCKTGGGGRFSTLCDLTSASAGTTINCGKTNTDTTLSVSQTISECGSGTNLDSLSACASASGFKPLALFQTFNGISGTAGVSDTAGVQEAFKKMMKAAYASGKPPSPADMVNMIKGDTSLINKFKALDSSISSLDTSSLADGMKAFPGACKEYYGSDTLYNNYVKAGVSSFRSGGANFFKNLKTADLDKIKAEPTLYQTIMGEYVSAAASGTALATAFKNFEKADFARTVAGLGQFIDVTDFSTSGKAAAYKNLLEGGTWGTSKDPAQLAEAFGNACKSGNEATEFASWNTNGAAFAGKYIDNPGAYSGTTGLNTINNQYITYIQNPTAFTSSGAKGCSSSSDCGSGLTCNTQGGFCVAACSSSCGFGAPCTSDSGCTSGKCSSGFCFYDTTISGFNPFTPIVIIGGTCTSNSQCPSGNCISGVCALPGQVAIGGACTPANLGTDCQSGVCGRHGLCLSTTSVTSGGVVTNLAGPDAGTTTAGSSDGAENAASFSGPAGVCMNPTGTKLYVVEIINNIIREITISTANVVTLAGTAGSADTTDGTGSAARFNAPLGCVVDPAGTNLYVVDGSNHTIRKIVISSAAVTTFAGTAGSSGGENGTGTSASFNAPYGIIIDHAGANLYVAEFTGCRIRKIVVNTQVVSTLAGSGTCATTDGTGTSAGFNAPAGLTIDSTDASLYVGESTGHRIRKIVIASGEVTTFAGSGSAASTDGTGTGAAFNRPRGIVIDPTNTNLYVAEFTGKKIRKIVVATQVVTTLAGSGVNSDTNGTGTAAAFKIPELLDIDPTGTVLYIPDRSSNKVRQIQ